MQFMVVHKYIGNNYFDISRIETELDTVELAGMTEV